MKASRRQTDSGFMMLEQIAAIILIAISALAASAMFNYGWQRIKKDRSKMTEERVVESLVNLVSMPASIRAAGRAEVETEPYNANLRICVFGNGWPPCKNLNGGAGYSAFRAYLPRVETRETAPNSGQYEFKTSGAITGTPDKPIRYNSFGAACDTSADECSPEHYPIEASTEFLPVCPTKGEVAWRSGTHDPTLDYPEAIEPTSSCGYARFLKVRLRIKSDVSRFDKTFNVTIDVALARHARQ